LGFARDAPSSRCTPLQRLVVCFWGEWKGQLPSGPSPLLRDRAPTSLPDYTGPGPFSSFRLPAQLFGAGITSPEDPVRPSSGTPAFSELCPVNLPRTRVDKGRLSTGGVRRSVPATSSSAGRLDVVLRAAPPAPPSTLWPPDRTSRTLGSGRASSRRRRRAAPPRETWHVRSARGWSTASFGPSRSFLQGGRL
jgi:hypothetical protein